MFRTKKDVDKHVADLFSKQKNEFERSLKGYNIARLYYEVKAYEMAQRHLASFLSIKDEHSVGHKLMGQISEVTGNSERALQCFKRSLDLDPNQKDVVLKVCELYCQLTVDPDTARYWADRAEKLFPHNKTVFKLRECIVNAEGEPNLKELENLISSELNARPRDVMLYIKMLKLYMDTERIDQAFNYSLKVEEKQLFPHSIDWYYCLSDICEAYQEEVGPQLKLEFCVHYVLVLNHLVMLLLAEPHFLPPGSSNSPTKYGRSVSDAASILQIFDQFLLKLSQMPLSKEGPFKYVFHHMKGQLYLHLACLLLKRAKKDQGNWKEACRYSAALLLVTYTFKSDNLYQEIWFAKMENKKPYQLIQQHGVLRLSYAGHILNSLCKDERNKFLQRMKMETCVPQVRDKIFQRAFSLLGKQTSTLSYFLQDSAFIESTLEFPSPGSLQEYDKVAHKVYPDSLHHLVWLTLHRKMENKTKNPPKFQVFEKLQYSSDVLNNGSPETLCQLDTEAFLIAAVSTTENAMEKRRSMMQRTDDSVLFFPPHIGDPLCTEEQTNWWRTAYSLYSNTSKEKMSEMRLILRRGLEVIRGVGNHGLDVSLIIQMARAFANQASVIRKRLGEDDQSEEVVALEERAVHYWTIALSLLNKVVTNRRLQQPKERLFGVGGKEPSSQEISDLREEGRFYIACHNMNVGCLEAAVEEFSKLSLPYASYNQAKVLKQLASQNNDKQKKIALLTKAKEALYSTMDRISSDRKHALNLTLQEEIEALEMKLTESQNESSSAYDDDRTDDGEPSFINGSPQRRLNISNGSYDVYSTPRNSPSKNLGNVTLNDTSVGHIRPSPERLDSQIRALAFTQENLITTLKELRTNSTEQQNTVLESNKAILNELKDMKKDVEGLKKQFDEFQKAKCQRCDRSRGPRIKSTTEEELDEEDEDNGYEDHLYDYSQVEMDNGYRYNAYGHGVLHGPQRGASNVAYNYPPAQPPMMLHYPHHQYPPGAPIGQPPMGPLDMSQARPRNYYPHFPPPAPGLPFSEGQQLPQFNFRMPPPNSGIISPASQPLASPQTRPSFNQVQDIPPKSSQEPPAPTEPLIASPSQSKADLAPTAEPSSTWNQSNSATNAPHAFQIPLPASVSSSGATTQPPAILSTPTFVASPFGSSQLTSHSQSSPLKTALTSTPNTSLFGSSGNWQSSPGSLKSPKKQDNSNEQASGNESEEETGGYFKPLIPLPAEIDVCTGEENEKILFEERAKLFRYTEKEWKERGVGVIKLLLNEALGRVRLVMRRDQVLKICANHYIKFDMELKPMKDNEKAWIWVAEDFADEEVKAEQFCIRFKTGEIAKSFKTIFDDAREKDGPIKDQAQEASIPEAKTLVEKSKDFNKKSIIVPQSGFGSEFKPPASSWTCDSCYIVNTEEKQACCACETPKPGAPKTDSAIKINSSFKFKATNPVMPSTPVAKDGFGDKFKAAAGSWSCEACYLANTADKISCMACEHPKPGAPKVDISNPTAFKFGFKPASVQPSTPNVFGGVDLSSSSAGFIKLSDQIVKPKPMEFKFGVPDVSKSVCNEVSSSTGVDLISNSQPASQPNGAKTVLGGFTFTVPPKVITEVVKKEDKPDISKEPIKPCEPKKESPFAGFQFTPPKLTTGQTQTQNIFGGSGSYAGSLSTKSTQPSLTFGSSATFSNTLSSNYSSSQPPHVFGTTTFGASFPTTPPTLTFANLSTSQSPKVGSDSAFTTVVTSKTSAFTPTPESPNTSKEVPEEFEPSVDFAPVVPLPELVEVKTGEEDEKVLFNERAKLFRFDPVTKEWKERGIGSAKILKNKDTGKFRMLMRREQVLKLCANHYILPEMALTAMSNSNKAWSWFAQDFSEGEVKTEHLAIRFKTKDLAVNFQKVFEKCAKESKAEKKLVEDIPISSTNAASHKLLSETFKPKSGSWECKGCYVINEVNATSCVSCGSSKDHSSVTGASSQTTKFSFTLPQKFKELECSACYNASVKNLPNCEFCGCPRPPKSTDKSETVSANPTSFKFGVASPTAPTNQVFGQKEYTFGNIKAPPSSNFAFGSNTGNSEMKDSSVKSIFGTTPNSSGPFSTTTKAPSDTSSSPQSSIEFRFGSPQKFEFNFTGPRARSPSKAPKSPGTPNDSANYGTEDEGDVSSDADNIFFQPVIPLPPKIDVKTGEEDEVAVYSQRAKLYRFDVGEWKERGTGDIKVLWNEKDNKARLLMRREQVLKTCLNHCLSNDIKLQKKNEKTWMWAASDFSDGEAKLEKFAIRFKSPEVADQFENMVEVYKNKALSPNKSTKSTLEKTTFSVSKRLDFSNLAVSLIENSQSLKDTPITTPPKESSIAAPTKESSIAAPTKESSIAATTKESSIAGPTKESSIAAPTKESSIAAPTKESSIAAPTKESSIAAPTKESSIAAPTKESSIAAPTKESSIAAPTNESSIAAPTNESSIAAPTNESSIAAPTNESSIASPPNESSIASPPNESSIASPPNESSIASPPNESSIAAPPNESSIAAPPNESSIAAPPNESSIAVAPLKDTPIAAPLKDTPISAPLKDSPISAPPKDSPISAPPKETSFTQPTSAATFSFKMNPSFSKSTGSFGLSNRFGVESPKSSGFSFGSSLKFSDSKFVISDISVVEEKKATIEQKQKAEKLQLPTNFYLYEKKEPCKGCRGCEECDKEVEVVYERVPSEEQLSQASLLQLPPSFFYYDEKPPCPGCRGCTDGEEIKTESLTSFNISSLIQEETKAKEPEPTIKTPGNNLFKRQPTDSPWTEDTSTMSGSFFGSFSTAGVFSFEALANQKTDNLVPFQSTTVKTKNIFEGAGTPLFAGKTAIIGPAGHNDEVAPSPEVHFEPVVPLPELVEVVTGEEEETSVFNERAKLFRFDKDTSQWKERGVGQFKILKHNSKCQYRLLLRREQVHKIACNHYITSEVELNKMTNSENSLCWTAMDFTEGTLISELFAIKFKTKDILSQFKKKFDECRQDICENLSSETTAPTVHEPTSPENEKREPIIEEPSEPIIEEPNEPIIEEPDDEIETEIVTGNETRNTENIQDYQEDDEGSDDESEVMFEKRATLAEKNNTHDYKPIGMGTLQIRYDDSIFGARIQMSNDSQEMLCYHFIALQTCLRVKDCDAFWTAIDMSVDPPKRRQFKASFSSKNALEEFERIFEEGKSMAIEAEIVERDDPPVRN